MCDDEKAKPANWWTQSLHAVRQNQYKLHWIVGGSHCPNNYADHDCRANTTEQMLDVPLLFNLYHDPSEHFPLNVSDPFYWNIVEELNATIEPYLSTKGVWAPSQMESNSNDQPCCVPGIFFSLFPSLSFYAFVRNI